MNFLKYKGFWFIKWPDGWEDLGEQKGKSNGEYTETSLHAVCHSRVHIGKENENIFYFCPMCKIVLK